VTLGGGGAAVHVRGEDRADQPSDDSGGPCARRPRRAQRRRRRTWWPTTDRAAHAGRRRPRAGLRQNCARCCCRPRFPPRPPWSHSRPPWRRGRGAGVQLRRRRRCGTRGGGGGDGAGGGGGGLLPPPPPPRRGSRLSAGRSTHELDVVGGRPPAAAIDRVRGRREIGRRLPTVGKTTVGNHGGCKKGGRGTGRGPMALLHREADSFDRSKRRQQQVAIKILVSSLPAT